MKFVSESSKLDNEHETYTEKIYPEISSIPNFIKIENEILDYWGKEDIRQKFLEKNKTFNRNYSFIDGPITANNPMGVHTAWGRTLKDTIQQYRALTSFQLRFQNGFDCQGLWVEVEVEKALELKSKKQIEQFGTKKFVDKCKQRIKEYSSLITHQSKRLGQWMDWKNSYYTHTDTNIEHIWHFLHVCHQKGWIKKEYLPMPWCIRCGTSLSQHEQHDSYEQIKHTALFVKFPLDEKNHYNEYLLVWITTPWTLFANTAVAINPNKLYCKIKENDEYYYILQDKLNVLLEKFDILETIPGKELVELQYKSPFHDLSAHKSITIYSVIPWDEVTIKEGTGLVHIAPGCGLEDFKLGKEFNLPIISPIDEFGTLQKNLTILLIYQ
ncbi:MAG: class I tRNA ligase family protein [Asgard group archaeon]|nr:class I tRNA ligase family protein [Asgard group archaeon]